MTTVTAAVIERFISKHCIEVKLLKTLAILRLGFSMFFCMYSLVVVFCCWCHCNRNCLETLLSKWPAVVFEWGIKLVVTVSYKTVTVALCIIMFSDSSLPRTDQSDSEALKEPSTFDNAMKTDKPPSRRRSVLVVLFFVNVHRTFLFDTRLTACIPLHTSVGTDCSAAASQHSSPLQHVTMSPWCWY